MVSATFGMAARGNGGFIGQLPMQDKLHSYTGLSNGDLGRLTTPAANSGFEDRPGIIEQFKQEYKEQGTSLMGMLQPKVSYEATAVDTSSLMVDVNGPITNGAEVSGKASMAMEDVQENQARFAADFKEARGEAIGALREAATDRGINGDAAVNSIVPEHDATKATAFAAIAATGGQAAFLGPLANAVSSAVYIQREVNDEKKKLDPQERKQLIVEALEKLHARAPEDTRAGKGFPVQMADTDDNQKSQYHWQNMNEAALTRLLRADANGGDQPEMKALMGQQYALEKVFDNHDHAAKNYGNSLTAAKIDAAGGAAIISNEEVAQIIVEGADQSRIDAIHVQLTGDSVAENSMQNQHAAPMMSEVKQVARTLGAEERNNTITANAPVFAARLDGSSLGLRSA